MGTYCGLSSKRPKFMHCFLKNVGKLGLRMFLASSLNGQRLQSYNLYPVLVEPERKLHKSDPVQVKALPKKVGAP